MDSVRMATPFTDARSCIAARSRLPPIPSSVERAVKSSLANSSQDSDLLCIAIWTKRCTMHPSEKNLSTLPSASPRRVDPSKMTETSWSFIFGPYLFFRIDKWCILREMWAMGKSVRVFFQKRSQTVYFRHRYITLEKLFHNTYPVYTSFHWNWIFWLHFLIIHFQNFSYVLFSSLSLS